MIIIAQIRTPEDVAAVRALVEDFVAWAATQDPDADSAPAFHGLQAELDGLPGIYAPPGGAFLLARADGQPAGCVAFRPVGPGTAEVKRMWVRPDRRGLGIGRRLVEALVAAARAEGHRRIVLDSYHTMIAAHAIYRRAGFRDVPAPEGFPEAFRDRVVFMAMDLT